MENWNSGERRKQPKPYNPDKNPTKLLGRKEISTTVQIASSAKVFVRFYKQKH